MNTKFVIEFPQYQIYIGIEFLEKPIYWDYTIFIKKTLNQHASLTMNGFCLIVVER